MAQNLLEKDIAISCEEQGIWNRRFRDMTMYAGSSSPFDYLLITKHTTIGIEAKLLRARKSGNPKSFPFSRVSDVQREGMQEFSEMTGYEAYVFVNFRWTNNKKGELYALPYNQFTYLENLPKAHKSGIGINNKSITLSYFRENLMSLERKDRGWDLSKIL